MDWGVVWQIAATFMVDYFAVIIGAVTGALFAIDRKLDIIGTVTLGLIVGYGGGIIRDTLLHDKGFFFMEHADCVVICIVACMLVAFAGRHIRHLDRILFHVDALSMALFALAGTSKAWAAGEGIVLAVVLGVITAVGGGAIRDICVGETPRVFKPSNYYALSAVAGCVSYTLLAALGCPVQVAGVVCVAVAFLLTALSDRYNWRSKEITHQGR